MADDSAGEIAPVPEQAEVDYGALRQAWVDTKMERDRSLLQLSAGGVALIVTLVTAASPSRCQNIVYGLAALGFLISLAAAVWIFQGNAAHIENLLSGAPPTRDPRLDLLDKFLVGGFAAGVCLTLVSAILLNL